MEHLDEATIRKAIAVASASEKLLLYEMLDELQARKRREEAQEKFIPFVRTIWPEFISGAHHQHMARLFEAVARGEKKRIIINLAPRHTKSEFSSYLLPAWFLGKFPKKKIMQVSNTAELAEGFGRKVRNLVGSDEYKTVFPDVGLRQDSKAAGRWNTNQGGEYYACISEDFLLHTNRGHIPAKNVEIGDKVETIGGWEKVEVIHHTTHDEIVEIAGVQAFSVNHPIWTMNRGWVQAGEIISSDMLVVETIYDIVKAKLLALGAYHGSQMEHTDVSSLVQHKITLRKSEQRKVPLVRGAWDICLRKVENIRQLFTGYAATAYEKTHNRSHRCEWPIFSSELPMGNSKGAVEQQEKQCSDTRENCGRTCQRVEHNPRSNTLQGGYGHDSRGSIVGAKAAESELWSYSDPENLGWLRNTAFRFIVYSRSVYQQITRNKKSSSLHTSSIVRGAQVLQGLLLGIRPAGNVRRIPQQDKKFINFTLSKSNTFLVGGILTHNCGVGSALAGRGADICIIDDPHDESAALAAQFNPAIYDKTYEWYTSGPRQRLQPNGALIICMTRWHSRDLTGQIVDASIEKEGVDQWEVIEFPAILPSGKPLWPEFWSLKELEAIRAEIPNAKWQAQYQQQPTSEQAAIIKREWWQHWDYDEPPEIDYLIMACDTAFEAKNSADYSAAVFFGVWYNPEDNDQPNLILLNAWRDKLEFPELKAQILEMYNEWQPDSCIIEKKASGAPLIYELRSMGISVQEVTPVRGTLQNPNSKLARLNAISDIFASGKVWAPTNQRWAEILIDEVASFPAGKNDDQVDCVVMALTRFRQGGFVGTTLDAPEEERFFRRKVSYY